MEFVNSEKRMCLKRGFEIRFGFRFEISAFMFAKALANRGYTSTMGPTLAIERWVVAVCCDEIRGDDEESRIIREVGDEANHWGGKLMFVDRCED